MKRSSYCIRGILRGDTRCKLNGALMAFAHEFYDIFDWMATVTDDYPIRFLVAPFGDRLNLRTADPLSQQRTDQRVSTCGYLRGAFPARLFAQPQTVVAFLSVRDNMGTEPPPDHTECNAIAERTFGALNFIFALADSSEPIRCNQTVHHRPVRAPT
jgi:hypothetical protein